MEFRIVGGWAISGMQYGPPLPNSDDVERQWASAPPLHIDFFAEARDTLPARLHDADETGEMSVAGDYDALVLKEE